MEKKPIPTAANPQPETSLYLKMPNPISNSPISIIIRVAHPKIVFLFIPIIVIFVLERCKYRYFLEHFLIKIAIPDTKLLHFYLELL